MGQPQLYAVYSDWSMHHLASATAQATEVKLGLLTTCLLGSLTGVAAEANVAAVDDTPKILEPARNKSGKQSAFEDTEPLVQQLQVKAGIGVSYILVLALHYIS